MSRDFVNRAINWTLGWACVLYAALEFVYYGNFFHGIILLVLAWFLDGEYEHGNL